MTEINKNNHDSKIFYSKTEISQKLQDLILDLGEQPAKRFINKSIPYIADSKQSLQQHLNHKEWEQAARLAHRMKGSLNLYSSTTLNALLRQINNQKVSEQELEKTQQALNQEFNLLLSELAFVNLPIDSNKRH